MRRVRVHVDGRVQGVFFRETTARRARTEDVSGWVRNLPDGRVEAVFEGPPDAVERLIEWCRAGPELAVVDEVEVVEEEPQGVDGFDVL
jgi:acylphosphatase